MSYYDEEFYGEPSEFDQQVDEFKRSITTSIKEEFQEEMIRLLQENTELQQVRTDFEKIKSDYRDKERKLESDYKHLVSNVRGERLKELMKDFEVLMFVADVKREQFPKCEKCNSQRRVKYTTPLGREAEEYCECSKTKRVHVTSEYLISEFKYNRYDHKMVVWYKPYKDEDDGYSSGNVPNSIYEEGASFESLAESWRTYFKNKEDCQNYCDWLNAKEVFE